MQLSKLYDHYVSLVAFDGNFNVYIFLEKHNFFPVLFSVIFNAECKPQLGIFFRINNRKNNNIPLSYFRFCLEINTSVSCCFPGLMYVIETQKVMDLKVNLMASYVIVPQTGFYNGTQNIILLDLGHFKV